MDSHGKKPENPPVVGRDRMMHALKALMVAACLLTLTACASAPPSPEALANNDPFETTNRQTLVLNGQIDRYVVVPTVGLYFLLVPDGGRRAVHNFLGNLSLPTIFVNDLLQGETTRGSQTLGRLVINTTLGLGGFFDPAASDFHIPGHGEDFGQTLAVWGAPEGPFLMLPFLGPSNPRDAAGLAVDAVIDPTNYIAFKQHIWWSVGREYFTVLDLRGQTYQTIQGIQRSSVDYYASLRSLYRQLRNNEIRNGRPERGGDLPDF
jgi:phospholipid-binding lipoprotein MlaA